MTVVFVAIAGGAGAAARFTIETLLDRRQARSFPVATLLINVTGSLLLGFLAGLVLFHGVSTTLKTVGGTGFCGGYTTFSAASFDTVLLAQRRQLFSAAANGIGTLLLAVVAAAVGLALAGG